MELLDHLSVARFTGAEAGDFLQSQLSADIAALQAGTSSFACYCTPRGQVLGLLLVCRRNDDFLVIGSSALLPGMLNRLRMFVFRARVEFALDAELAVQGLEMQETAEREDIWRPEGVELGYLLSEANESKPGKSAFKWLEIGNRVTWLCEDTSEKYIPQMLGFDRLGAVSFSKGCYPGQEIVARARYLGKVKRQPFVVETEAIASLSVGDRLELERGNDWVKSTVVDWAQTGDGRMRIFVVAPSEPAGDSLAIRHDGRVYSCATT